MPSDYELALKLQQELDAEQDYLEPVHNVFKPPNPVPANRKRAASPDDLNATQNIVHPEWETLDPTPDVQALFGAFDGKFFQGKLRCVQLEWSKRMYQCAGICYYRRNRMGSSITIRLSEPLLKLRQRKDLIETMLHEMIHAYLFVLNIREGNGGHGPNFKRIMVSINQTAGTNITVYHSFHDEVNLYKTHVWRCNGICQHRKPFYGYVKRTCNRAPSANDQWWPQHQQTCGGYFAKISGPAANTKKESIAKPEKKASGSSKKATALPPAAVQRIDNPKWGLNKPGPSPAAKAASSSVRTVTTYNPTITSDAPRINRPANSAGNLRNVRGFKDLNTSDSEANGATQPGSSRQNASIGGNLRNVIGFKDLNGTSTHANVPNRPEIHDLTTGGYSLGSAGGQKDGRSNAVVPVISQVREVWSSRYRDINNSAKKPRLSSVVPKEEPHAVQPQRSINEPTSSWKHVGDVDDDDAVLIQEVKYEVINLSDSDDDYDAGPPQNRQHTVDPPPRIKPDPDERQRAIKTEIMADADDDEDEIILIDDDFDDDIVDAMDGEIADTSVIDDIFGTDTLLSGFNEINDAMPGQPKDEEIVSCPICSEKMCRDVLADHLNGCQGIKVVISKGRKETAHASSGVFRSAAPGRVKTDRELLADCGYTEEEIDVALNGRPSEETEYNRRIERELEEEAAARRRDRGSTRPPPATTTTNSARTPKRASFSQTLTSSRTPSAVTPPAVTGEEDDMADCPVCSAKIGLARMNDHLDVCLSSADCDSN